MKRTAVSLIVVALCSTGQAHAQSTRPDTVMQSYGPTLIEMPTMPLPVPPALRGLRFEATFYVDSLGKIDSLKFAPTPDAKYRKGVLGAQPCGGLNALSTG